VSLLRIDVRTIAPLFNHDLGAGLLLVTSPRVREAVAIAAESDPIAEMTWSGPEDREKMLASVEVTSGHRRAILWIADSEFEHVARERLANGKLAAISVFSDSAWNETLPAIWELVAKTDYLAQQRTEERLVSILRQAARLVFYSPGIGEASFAYRRARNWFSLHGPLGWGDQTVLPTGELSVLTDTSGAFSDQRLNLDGIVSLRGAPIVHRGSARVGLEAVDALAAALAPLEREVLIAEVRDGAITAVEAYTDGAKHAARALAVLFARDVRYRKIHEVGFGTNACCRPLRSGNFFANERYPGLHLGIGLGGYTDFHIDLVCADVEVDAMFDDGRCVDFLGLSGADSSARATGGQEGRSA